MFGNLYASPLRLLLITAEFENEADQICDCVRNHIPCQCCDEAYRRSTTVQVDPITAETSTVHAMWPFFGCVSYEPFSDGRCGNCWWVDKKCSWSAVEEGHVAWHLKAKEKGPKVEHKLMEVEVGELIPLDIHGAIRGQEERYNAGQRRKKP